MTQTEISEHAKEASEQFRKWLRPLHQWDKGSACELRLCEDIQHGINLATAEKDARIAELEADYKTASTLLQSSLEIAQQDSESKDREIERLKEEHSELEMHILTGTQQLTEANAKLAEDKEKFDLNDIARIGAEEHVTILTRQLSSAQAEIERLKVQLDIAFHPSHLTPTNETP